MTEDHHDQNLPTGTQRPAIRWDAAAIIASMIGFLALLVAGYTAYVQRYTARIQLQQVSAQVWTRLFFASSEAERSFAVVNKGVGPASIESVRVYVDGKAQPDWSHVFAALGAATMGVRVYTSLNGLVVSANERTQVLQFKGPQDWSDYMAQANRVKMRVCYCSVLNECLVVDEREVHRGHGAISSQVVPVARCERVETEEFNG